MKAAFINRYGKNEKLIYGDQPLPVCLKTDVLIKVHAASINPIDFKTRNGTLRIFRKYEFPLILGHDLSGEVVEVGQNVENYKVGDLVFTRPRNGRIGAFSEFIAVDCREVSLKPENLSHYEAASLPLVALTSYQSINDVMKLSRGQKILIQAGSGGIGSVAIQIAKNIGAEVWTTTSAKNVEFVKSLGADHIIDYRKFNVFDQVKELDAVFDTLGGDSLYESFRVVKPNGWVVSISGDPDLNTATAHGLSFLKKQIMRLYGMKVNRIARKSEVNYAFHFMESRGDQLAILKDMAQKNLIKPIIDKVFSLDQAQQAIEYSESGRARGKIIIKVI